MQIVTLPAVGICKPPIGVYDRTIWTATSSIPGHTGLFGKTQLLPRGSLKALNSDELHGSANCPGLFLGPSSLRLPAIFSCLNALGQLL